MLDALVDEDDALAVIGEARIVGAELFDEAAIARRAHVGNDDVVERALGGAGAGETKFESHSEFL